MSEQPDAGPVLVGVDGSESSREALRVAARLAQALGAPLEVVTCWEDPLLYGSPYVGNLSVVDSEQFRLAREQQLESALAGVFGDRRPEHLTTRLLRGHPATRLTEESEHAQMLVVGRRDLGGVLGMILGSVSSAVVSHAQCSVLVVRH